jgi:putative transposase
MSLPIAPDSTTLERLHGVHMLMVVACRVRAIHAKIANRRKDSLHQLSTRLVRGYDTIFVGNVNASTLAKTPHAKSVLDAGWSAFRTMLRYKCDFAGATFAEVDEAFSTQTCSACDSRSGPKGIAGLGIRAWTCSGCGTVHDRNVNAAKNMLAAGRRRLAEGIPALEGAGGRQLQSTRFFSKGWVGAACRSTR